jgi:isoleucyl-tRNA synthetase
MQDAAVDYKSTLNLPDTPFPMRGDLRAASPGVQEWKQNKVTRRSAPAVRPSQVHPARWSAVRQRGDPHGHAVNKILKDIVVKSRQLGGSTPYVPRMGLPRHADRGADREDARQARRPRKRSGCAAPTRLSRSRFRRKISGVWASATGPPYTTMAYANEANEIRELGKLLLKGYLTAAKPVNWCFDCQSAGGGRSEYEIGRHRDRRSVRRRRRRSRRAGAASA